MVEFSREYDFEMYDTVLVVVKSKTTTGVFYLKGILLKWEDDEDYHDKDYNFHDVKIAINYNGSSKKINVKDLNFKLSEGDNNRMNADCKILPCRIVLIEKTNKWMNKKI